MEQIADSHGSDRHKKHTLFLHVETKLLLESLQREISIRLLDISFRGIKHPWNLCWNVSSWREGVNSATRVERPIYERV
jgi:hypothetical protein